MKKDLYKNTNRHIDLLKDIGKAQMENELLKRYKSIAKRTNLTNNIYNVVDLKQEEIKKSYIKKYHILAVRTEKYKIINKMGYEKL